MKRSRRFANLRFASKMLLLVGLMGFIAVAITAYALINMRLVNQQYSDLIKHEGQGALTIAEAGRHLNNASHLAYTVLTEPDETRMLESLSELHTLQQLYHTELRKLESVLPAKSARIHAITADSQRLFETAERIITAASRWRGDQAVRIIHQEFEPSLKALRIEMTLVRDEAVSQFNTDSTELNHQTSQTILIAALAIAGALLLVIPLSLYVASTHMSRPIAQLTHTMERMSQRHYDDTVALTERRDEVGQMAKALQVFQRSMQREDRLAVEVAASAEARRLSEQLVDLISAIPGAVFQMHVAPGGMRRILFVSDKAAQLHGRTLAQLQQSEESVGREFLQASEREGEHAREAFLRSMRTLAPLDFDTATARDGQTRWIKTLATARRTPDGGALFNGVWLDVTEQKLQAQALTQAKNSAEKAAEDKARFLATMSHEIRTPLNAVLGMTQLALRYETHAPQRDRIEKTMRAGRHLLNIVNDVLDISKIEAGKLRIEPEDFAPREWLEELRDLLLPQAQAKALELHLHITPTTPEQVRGDRQRMSQIVLNYLNNAIKFTETGYITVSLDATPSSPQGVMLCCEVQDTGMGISESDQAALFTTFVQADASITRRFEGTGLGLAISRRLAELMGGAAGVRSAPGAGSTFWFTARVDVAVAPVATAGGSGGLLALREGAARLPYQGLRTGPIARILVVDDNELNRAVALGMLEVGGIAVDEACDGAQAIAVLEAASQGTYAAVLMDMQMPVMDGLSATRQLRQNPRFAQLPIIALTANASEDDIVRTLAAGMNDHLSKPLLEEALWCCLRRWLRPQLPSAAPLLPAMDARALGELYQVLGAERAGALVTAFVKDCEARLERIRTVMQKTPFTEWSELAKDAHNLSGSAGSFGLGRLGDLAHKLHALSGQRDETTARPLIAQLLQCAPLDLAALETAGKNQLPPT